MAEPDTGVVGPDAAELVRRCRYGEIARRHFSSSHATLYRQLTGRRFRVAWTNSLLSSAVGGEESPVSPLAGSERIADSAATLRCQACSVRHFTDVLRTARERQCLHCPVSDRNRWIPIVAQGVAVGVGFVAGCGDPCRVGERWAGHRAVRGATVSPRHANFEQAVKLLRLIVRLIEISVQLDLTREELAGVTREAAEHRQMETVLRGRLANALPIINPAPASAASGARSEQLVRRMLEYIGRNYAQPITLQRCAEHLGMSPVYLCALFSRTVGVPFKSYLTCLRLERARELLGDPVRRVSEVAFAVGYADSNRFRVAFKAATGQSPALWRDRLRVDPPARA